jgi:hypothetical protein
MPAATARLALPYPVPNDTVDVPRDVLALATKLDPATAVFAQGLSSARPAFGVPGRFYYATDSAELSYDTGTAWRSVAPTPAFVTSLPTSPIDAQEVYYLADNANGLVWHLRYRAASASAYKWECVGGPPLNVSSGNVVGLNFAAGVVVPGLALTAPLTGAYDFSWGVSVIGGTPGVELRLSGYVVGGNGVFGDNVGTTGNQPNLTPNNTCRMTMQAGQVVQCAINTGDGSYVIAGRFISLSPVRFG